MHFIVKLRTILLCNCLYLSILILALVYAYLNINYVKRNSIYNINEKEFYMTINSYKIKNDKINFTLKGKEDLIGNYYLKNKEKIKDFNIGDTLKITGELITPNNNTIPNTFNYKKYLNNKNIYYVLNIDSYEVIKNNKKVFNSIKNIMYERANKYDKNGYLYAFILGKKDYIDEKIYKTYSNNGITHLFALSGLHVGTLSVIIFFFFKKLKIKEIYKYILVFLLLFIFSFITGYSASILRAVFLFLFIGINKIYYFYIKSENLLLLLLSFFLCFNPYYIYDLSFTLSFTITYFILINTENIKGNYIIQMLKISSISFLASLPIVVNNFYSVNVLSIINNLFFVPYVTFIIFPFSLLVFLFPSLYSIYIFLIIIMEKISIIINTSIFTITIPKISVIFIIFYYIFLILYYKKCKKIYLYLIIFMIIFNINKSVFNKNTYVYFVDVGQGDSCLIRTKNNKSILIDTGGNTSYYNSDFSLMNTSIIPFYKSINIRKIDYLFLSHGDNDHSGYTIDLINNYKTKKIYINRGEVNELEKKIDNYNITTFKHIKIDNVMIYSLNDKIYDNENDNSLVFLIVIENYKFLFMGDAGIIVENDLIKKYNLDNIDFLKVGHHGSDTSSSKEFISKINPKNCLISVGKNNKYGHPKESVLNILKNCNIYRTDNNATIEIKLNNKKYDITTTNS